MSIYYHKQITIIPKLLRLNIGTHGWSLSFGPRRAHVTRHSGRAQRVGATAGWSQLAPELPPPPLRPRPPLRTRPRHFCERGSNTRPDATIPARECPAS